MPRGYPTPNHIEEFILNEMREVPEIKAASLAARIQEKFRTKIDKSTVGKKLRKYGSSPAAKDAPRGLQPVINPGVIHNATLLRVRAHQRDLLTLMKGMRGTVEYYPSADLNSYSLGDEEPPKIPWEGIEPLLWQGLEEHLKGDQLWAAAAEWNDAASAFAQTMRQTNEKAITVGEKAFGAPLKLEHGGARLTQIFPAAVRQAILYGLGLNPGRSVHLTWSNPGQLQIQGGYYMATSLAIDFPQAESLFWQVVREVEESGTRESIGNCLNAIRQASPPLITRLAFFQLRREVPGSCDLCR